jgi:hypothetical protein
MSRWHEGKSNREAARPVSVAHRQMDPIRRTARKKPHAAPSGDGGIVPRLFMSTLGCRLLVWAHTVHGSSETRLRRLLFGTRKVALAVAPAEIRDQRNDLRVTEGDATSGNNSDGIKATFAAGSGGAAEQGTHRVLGFRTILRGGKLAALHRWMEQVRKTGIYSLVRFVRTLKQDLNAAESAVSTPWSNGPVEGHINRLKILKRQMYGRAGIELLRARLLPEPEFSDP